jgi:hypothetical protein
MRTTAERERREPAAPDVELVRMLVATRVAIGCSN